MMYAEYEPQSHPSKYYRSVNSSHLYEKHEQHKYFIFQQPEV